MKPLATHLRNGPERAQSRNGPISGNLSVGAGAAHRGSSFKRNRLMTANDLVIRGATVIDGLGNKPIRADVAVRNGRITAVGEIGSDGAEIVDAGGLALMPGIIDLHTHYDAQVTWDPTLSPSPSLGVTTAVMGNCGFGIVPIPPPLRDKIMRNLAVVEGGTSKRCAPASTGGSSPSPST